MLYPTGIKAGMAPIGQTAPTTGLPPALASLPAGKLFSGVVVSRDGTGNLLLRTAGGMALIATSMKLARGTVVNLRVRGGVGRGAPLSLSIESVAAKSGGLPGLPQAAFRLGLVTELNEAMALLAKSAAPSGLAVPGDKLTSALLFFLAAVKQGDFAGWFGVEATRALKAQGRSDLLARLSENFGHQARLADRPAAGEWQALFVPLLDGETVRQLRFFFRRPKDSNGHGDGDRDSRFIVEIESSRLGGMQVDGLIGPARFDLVLRSHEPLPDGARRDISEIFSDGLAITGQTGRIVFQTVEKFPPAPMESLRGQENPDLLV
jgi:hypothetical protein